jgi:hypothetical protein
LLWKAPPPLLTSNPTFLDNNHLLMSKKMIVSSIKLKNQGIDGIVMARGRD